jgi:hypothetical protein
MGANEAQGRIVALEAEIDALQAEAQRASSTLADMEAMLCKERQSALEVMDLLTRAQDKFSVAAGGR